MDDKELVLDPEVQPLSHLECQISNASSESVTYDELIHFDSIPLCSNSFQILKVNLGHILVDNHRRNHEVSLEPMLQPSKALHDPIVDMLDGLCFQSQVSFTRNDFKRCYDMDMIRQSTPLSFSAEVSLQISSNKMQTCFELFEDIESTCAIPGHEVKLTNSEYQIIGHVYHDPIAIYMEELFFSKCPLIPKVYVIVHSPRDLCCEDQVGNHSMLLMQVLFPILVKNSERAELLEKLLDWLHWHFSIT